MSIIFSQSFMIKFPFPFFGNPQISLRISMMFSTS